MFHFGGMLTDAEVHEVVIDLAATRLYYVDILPANTVLDLAAAFPNLELAQYAIAWRDAERVTDILDEFRMGVASQNNDISDHICGGGKMSQYSARLSNCG
jgi:hypothetical protein